MIDHYWKIKKWSFYLACLVILIASLVLSGWLLNIDFLKRPIPNTMAMNPTTAFCFVAVSVSFLLITSEKQMKAKVYSGYGAVLIVLGIGIVKVIAFIFDMDLPIDQILFAGQLEEEFQVDLRGNMAPNTALSFILASIALPFIHRDGKQVYAQSLTLLIAFIALFSIVGYIYRVPEFYNEVPFIPMSIQAAISFFFFSVAILFAAPDKGLMIQFTSSFHGSRISRVLMPSAIIIPIILGYLRLLWYWQQAFSTELGVAVLILSIITVMVGIIWFNVVQLNKHDQQRKRYEEDLSTLNTRLQVNNEEMASLNEELSAANEELLSANNRLTVSNKALEEAVGFKVVVESAPNAMVLVDQTGKISLVNNQTEKLFGYLREELLGKKIEVLIPDRFIHGHPGYRTDFFRSPKARSMGIGRDLFAKRKNGSEFPVEIGLNPIETPDGSMVLAAIIDITERKKAEERFRLVVESAPNAMVLVNEEGKITLINGQAEKLFGYTRSEFIGKEVEALIPKRFSRLHPGFRKSFFTKPKIRSMGAGRELYGTRKDGSEFPVEIGLNPIESPEGHMVLASIIDITERKMQESNRLKSEFLANMSHELRTPMNAVLGFSELLIDKKVGDLNPKQLEYLKDIHASGSHLLQLINNVLDLAKIESGKIDLMVESFDLSETIEEVIKVITPIADKKGVRISKKLAMEIGVINLDKGKFRQILFNLLSNAIKFNSNNGSVSIETTQTGSNTFTIHVTDTGIGISDENLKKLFVPFVQLDTGLARQHEGSGLGLALTKNIVELHRGEISVSSTVGNGSTFTVKMPLSIEDKM